MMNLDIEISTTNRYLLMQTQLTFGFHWEQRYLNEVKLVLLFFDYSVFFSANYQQFEYPRYKLF